MIGSTAFQLYTSYTSLSPIPVLSLYSAVVRTRFTQDCERNGMKYKEMMPAMLQISKEIVPGKKSEFWRANG